MKLTLLFALLLILSTGQAQTSLRVSNPQEWWGDEPGTIEEATLTIHPKGLFMEVGLYLTFSAAGTYYGPGDSLEVTLDFDLPTEALVIDSWLWVGDEIIQADLIDRWTATGIYEEIVDRRQDPSILYKNGPGRYQLRVYPMAAQETRRVKITWLAPVAFRDGRGHITLPNDILRSSHLPLSWTEIRTWPAAGWSDPQLNTPEALPFSEEPNPVLGNFFYSVFTPAAVPEALSFSLAAPLTEGIFLNHHPGSGIYQLAFDPRDYLDLPPPPPRKALFILDYEAGHSLSITKADLLNHLRSALLTDLEDVDSFNILYMHGIPYVLTEPRLAAPQWLPADPDVVASVFNTLTASGFVHNSHLPELLGRGITYLQAQGGAGQIIVLSNSQDPGHPFQANQLLDELTGQMAGQTIPIHVIDFQTHNLDYFWGDDTYYRGNEYLYDNLTRMTGGSYYQGSALGQHLASTIATLRQPAGDLDVYTTLDNGFCFGRYHIGHPLQGLSPDLPIRQVGRYFGAFPFRILLNGQYEGLLFSEEIVIDPSAIQTADSTARQVWTGSYLRELEGQSATNAVVSEIIDESMDKRVLSLYTAFLCLEPNLGAEPCITCIDDTDGGDDVIISTGEVAAGEPAIRLSAAPNPFVDRVRIQLSTHIDLQWKKAAILLYDLNGQLLRSFSPSELETSESVFTLEWDGRDAAGHPLPSGVYILVIKTPVGTWQLRLVKAG